MVPARRLDALFSYSSHLERCLHSQDGSSFLLGGCDQLRKQQVWTNTLNYCLFAVLSFTY